MSTELDDIVEKLSNLKVVDLAKLKQKLEETWDVTAAAPVAMAGAVAAAPQEEAAAEATDFQVSVTEVPADKKIAAIKVIREVTGLGLKEAKDMAENPPKVLKESAPKAEAEEILKKLEAAGAKGAKKGV